MNLVDVFIAIAILVGIIGGLNSGFIRQVAGLLAVLLGFAIGIQVMGPVGQVAANTLGLPAALASVLVFIGVILAVNALVLIGARVIETVAGALFLSPLNRILGGAVGGLKAALIASIVLLLLATFNRPNPESRDDSLLYQPVAALLPQTWDMVAQHLPVMKRVTDEFGRGVADRLDINQ